jgi:CRP/FNR family cyclic AMP-dependent transcriptional regulator
MKPKVAAKNLSKFDPKAFLSTIDGGRQVAAFPKKRPIFVQGDSSNCVFYIQNGKIKLTVVSKVGKEATVGILNEGDFFGEGCLTGQTLRLCSATPMTDCSVMRIDKKSMVEVLHREQAFSEMFVAYLLARNIRYEGGFVGPTLQFQRKEASTNSAVAGSLRQGRRAPYSNPQDQSGEPCRDDRHDSVAGELFHEQV